MKTKTNTPTKTTAPSVVSTPTPAPAAAGGFTLGLDLGDRRHYVCALDAAGQILHEGTLPNDRAALALLLTKYPAATVALEAGTHSPWISRYLTGLGATVIVANPRKLHAISRHERKCDRRDAVMLARLARAGPALLHPIQHGSARRAPNLTRSASAAIQRPGASAGGGTDGSPVPARHQTRTEPKRGSRRCEGCARIHR